MGKKNAPVKTTGDFVVARSKLQGLGESQCKYNEYSPSEVRPQAGAEPAHLSFRQPLPRRERLVCFGVAA